jgi:flavin-dependent dehydrogenase
MTSDYDVIVVGARCAGSPTAMLLARAGHRVLLVDRATFPSDTVSTHFLHPPGVAALARWGLLDPLAASGCRPFTQYTFDFGPVTLTGTPGTAFGPRRTVLDGLLVEAASSAGVEVREGFTVDDVVVGSAGRVTGIQGRDRHGRRVVERALVVVGADGKHSRVAAAVGAPAYDERPATQAAYYAYWSGLPADGAELYIRPDRVLGAIPTHDDLTLVLVAFPLADAAVFRRDVEGNVSRALEAAPGFGGRVRAGHRETRFHASGDLIGFFRRPFGPGWALVGDAGYTVDPGTAQGISDAFRDAERVAGAIGDGLAGRRSFEEAMADAQAARDAECRPMYEFAFALATHEPPPPDLAALLAASVGNQEAMDAFARMFAGVMPVPDYFAPEHVGRILQAAA